MRIAGIANDSIVDGPGIRFTIFTQGCKHNCPGCHNPQTHPFDGGYNISTEELLNKIKANPLLDGVTFSGGDPMEQPKECYELSKAIKELGLNIYCYTGYTYEYLLKENNPDRMNFLSQVDYLVDGPFILEQRSLSLRFKGSSNQRIIDVKNSSIDNVVLLDK